MICVLTVWPKRTRGKTTRASDRRTGDLEKIPPKSAYFDDITPPKILLPSINRFIEPIDEARPFNIVSGLQSL
jgi:hypothetical protein